MKRIIPHDTDLLEHWSVSGANLEQIKSQQRGGAKNRKALGCKDGGHAFLLKRFDKATFVASSKNYKLECETRDYPSL
jgi:hypothetical protein